jgi:hypothetical protein
VHRTGWQSLASFECYLPPVTLAVRRRTQSWSRVLGRIPKSFFSANVQANFGFMAVFDLVKYTG